MIQIYKDAYIYNKQTNNDLKWCWIKLYLHISFIYIWIPHARKFWNCYVGKHVCSWAKNVLKPVNISVLMASTCSYNFTCISSCISTLAFLFTSSTIFWISIVDLVPHKSVGATPFPYVRTKLGLSLVKSWENKSS